jgi:hypothetical protein
MESGFMQMVVADTMKKRPFIAILCMHKMRTRAISLGYGGCKNQSLSSMVKQYVSSESNHHLQHSILHHNERISSRFFYRMQHSLLHCEREFHQDSFSVSTDPSFPCLICGLLPILTQRWVQFLAKFPSDHQVLEVENSVAYQHGLVIACSHGRERGQSCRFVATCINTIDFDLQASYTQDLCVSV